MSMVIFCPASEDCLKGMRSSRERQFYRYWENCHTGPLSRSLELRREESHKNFGRSMYSTIRQAGFALIFFTSPPSSCLVSVGKWNYSGTSKSELCWRRIESRTINSSLWFESSIPKVTQAGLSSGLEISSIGDFETVSTPVVLAISRESKMYVGKRRLIILSKWNFKKTTKEQKIVLGFIMSQ